MKHLIAIAATIIVIGAHGALDEAALSPIYWLDGISYAQDEHTSGTGHITTRHDIRGELETTSDVADIKKDARQTELGSRLDVKTHTTVSPVGRPSGSLTVDSQSYAETKFKWERERIEKLRSLQRTWEGAEQQARDEIQTSSSDWKLRFNIKFKNVSTNRVFEYKRAANSTGLQIVVLPADSSGGEPHKIPVKPESLDKDYFVLRTNGGTVALHVEQLITNRDVKRILRAAEIRGELNKCVTVEFDDQFRLANTDDANKLWSYCDASACKVNLIGFGKECKAKLPIVVDYRGLTYSNIFETASMELPSGKGFGFSPSGAIDNIFGRGLGRFAKDENGVYVILLEMHGEVRDRLSGDELKNKPSSKYDNNDLRFVRVGLEDIYYGLAQYPDSVTSNCFAYIEGTRDISDWDLFACAMIAKECRNNRIFGHCLSRMQNIGMFLQDENDIICAMSLIIETDNVEYFKKLYSLGWGRTDRTMLGCAAGCGSLKIVKWLLEEAPEDKRPKIDGLVDGATKKTVGDAGKTPLFWAAKNGHLKVCQYLVSMGADVNRKFCEVDVNSKKSKEYDKLIKEGDIQDAHVRNFIIAQREVLDLEDSWWRSRRPNVSIEKMKRWVDDGVLPDSYLGFHWNLLSWAVELGDAELVATLIDKGASVSGEYAVTPVDKRSPLMFACEIGDTNLVAKLISKGADLYVCQDKGMTAFHYAILKGNYNCAERLIENNLEVTRLSVAKIDGKWLDPLNFCAKYCKCEELRQRLNYLYPESMVPEDCQ